MDIRDSFSRLKRRVKHIGGKRKPDRIGSDIDGESVSATNPLPRPEPHVVAGCGEEDGADTTGWQACSTGQPPQSDEPELVPASGNENDRGGDAGVDGEKVSPGYSHPRPDVEVRAGGGPDLGGNEAEGEGYRELYSCSFIPSTPCSEELDGVWT